MARNRVIGCDNQIPWHYPEDFRWFKKMTTGNTVVMGRKTFESIGRALPNRRILILSRSGFRAPGTDTVVRLEDIHPERLTGEVFICGGAEIYRQTLPGCSDLYLTVVDREVEGDTFFPHHESRFHFAGIVAEFPEFNIQHWIQDRPDPPPCYLTAETSP